MIDSQRTRFEASMDKRSAVKSAEAAGIVADSMDIRLSLMDRVRKGEITLEQAQYELKKIKNSAEREGKITRSQAFGRG